MRAPWLAIVLVAGLGLAGYAPTNTAASMRPIPILGVPSHTSPHLYAVGWGTVRPSEIWNGGNLSSLVKDITWSTWSGSKAIGHGVGVYIPHANVSNKGYAEVAVVVAFDLGNCQGHMAYRALDVYFPTEGEKLVPSQGLQICPSL
jgi:hypothetical protein